MVGAVDDGTSGEDGASVEVGAAVIGVSVLGAMDASQDDG